MAVVALKYLGMMRRQQYQLHRLLLDKEIPVSPTNSSSYISGDSNFDSNMVIILAALLCALVCALGLNSIVRCALRCGQSFSFETQDQAVARLASAGLKKEALGQIPVTVYNSGEIPATECPICLGEFLGGEKLIRRSSDPKNLPGGSLGLPVIGESFSFIKAQTEDRGPEWINERVLKHGPVFKTSLLGSPTVVIVGQAGNKFMLGSDEDVLVAKQPKTLSAIGGKDNIFEITGLRYKLIKGAMVSFLKPESLQNYIKQMDDQVKTLFLEETKEKDTITAVIFMKKITFNIACNILFGIHDESTINGFFDDFSITFKAVWSIPVNFPGTVFWKGLRARKRISNRLMPIMKQRREELSLGIRSPTSDIMSCMLALRAQHEELIHDEMLVDNFVTLMIASHDTSAILLSLMVWKMSRDPQVYQKILQEQVGIMTNKGGSEEKLTWGDVQKMKYTWRVAQELLRVIPPVFGTFRRALKDTSFGGYDIPKGWQLFWHAHGTHMNKDIFENPTEFDPSRFENSSKPIPPYVYLPFGAGVHTCVGNEFARVETLTTIHRLVTMYEWSLVYPDEVITRQPMPYPSKGLPIKVKPISTF